MEKKIKNQDSKVKTVAAELPAPPPVVYIVEQKFINLAIECNNVLSLDSESVIETVNVSEKAIIKDIRSVAWLITASDFNNEGGFTEEAKNTLESIGVTIPIEVKKAAKKAKEKKDRYTRSHAFVDALKAGSGTKDVMVERANRLHKEHNPKEAETEKDCTFGATVFRHTMPPLVLLGFVEFNEETEEYSLVMPSDNELEPETVTEEA